MYVVGHGYISTTPLAILVTFFTVLSNQKEYHPVKLLIILL